MYFSVVHLPRIDTYALRCAMLLLLSSEKCLYLDLLSSPLTAFVSRCDEHQEAWFSVTSSVIS